MTALGIRLRLAISRSKLPEKALVSAVEDAERPKMVELDRSVMCDEIAATAPKRKRTYRRRDMRAE